MRGAPDEVAVVGGAVGTTGGEVAGTVVATVDRAGPGPAL
jgi:hypothetical protein